MDKKHEFIKKWGEVIGTDPEELFKQKDWSGASRLLTKSAELRTLFREAVEEANETRDPETDAAAGLGALFDP